MPWFHKIHEASRAVSNLMMQNHSGGLSARRVRRMRFCSRTRYNFGKPTTTLGRYDFSISVIFKPPSGGILVYTGPMTIVDPKWNKGANDMIRL